MAEQIGWQWINYVGLGTRAGELYCQDADGAFWRTDTCSADPAVAEITSWRVNYLDGVRQPDEPRSVES